MASFEIATNDGKCPRCQSGTVAMRLPLLPGGWSDTNARLCLICNLVSLTADSTENCLSYSRPHPSPTPSSSSNQSYEEPSTEPSSTPLSPLEALEASLLSSL